MHATKIFACTVLLLAVKAQGQEKPLVTVIGRITDAKGLPLQHVNVHIAGTLDGDATDVDGRFHFQTARTGIQRLRATRVGYDSASVPLNLAAGDSVHVDLVLEETYLPLSEVRVLAGAYSTGDELKGTTLRSLEVLTTAGTAGDILRVVQTFPGVSSLDEGSGLFVRGGDVSETVILLDQATVYHPYRYETPTGGVFGTIPPLLIRGTHFSTGGFSARYGNALSGILAMESLDMPQRLSYLAGLGLAAGSIGVAIPLLPGKLGLRFSGNRSFTDLMFRVNRIRHRFTTAPRGSDANLSLVYVYSNTGQLKLFNFVSTNRVGARIDEPSFEGRYQSEETSWLHALHWKDVIHRSWILNGSLSFSRFRTNQQFGNMQITPSDAVRAVRVDADRWLWNRFRLSLGVEHHEVDNSFVGTLPSNPDVFNPGAEVYRLDEHYQTSRGGGYAEVETHLSRRVVASAGARIDRSRIAKQTVIDPRLSMRYLAGQETVLRFSWGRYSQFPQPMLYNETSGNPDIDAQWSHHVVVGLEHSADHLMFRLEAYRKTYADLVLRAETTKYANMGDGVARGIDCFVKYGGFLQTRASGWVSYSYLHSRRLQARDVGDRLVYETAPSAFDVTHNLTVVGKVQLMPFMSASMTFRYATGRPVTPIIGAVRHPGKDYYTPIYGPINSQRLPPFVRLDGGLSYFLPFGTSSAATVYGAVSNLLDRANGVRYEYSPDYSERRLRTSDYRRLFYVGASVSVGSLAPGM